MGYEESKRKSFTSRAMSDAPAPALAAGGASQPSPTGTGGAPAGRASRSGGVRMPFPPRLPADPRPTGRAGPGLAGRRLAIPP